ncbi:hypothetical protein KJ644_02195 [Candidatus Dependentiae bacterium]|nr:hypothetical protein [Candidatus Dependentiae bacterium]MBU4387264.1 hypothetical protein [Candidatus Dependentiae bacterium]MCG2756029.1 hypothetical protein [Candidatus Dependentiae bacterium]
MYSFVKKYLGVFVSVLTVILFVGCGEKSKKDSVASPDSVKEQTANSIVLLNVDGKQAISEDDFNKHLAQMLQANPYFRGASAESLPKELKRKFFDELVKQELIIAWANKNNVDADAEFQKNYEELKKLVRRSLLVQAYEKKLFEGVDVTDADIKNHFDKNKDKFVKDQGGVLVEGVEFTNDADALLFLNKVSVKESDFKKMAKLSFEKSYKSFNRVAEKQSAEYSVSIPKEIKEKVLALTKYPSIIKVAVNGKVWVIHAFDKKDTVYFDLNEIKDQLKEMLKMNKFRDILNENVDKLRKEFTLDINEDYFKEAVSQMPGAGATSEEQEIGQVVEEEIPAEKPAAA